MKTLLLISLFAIAYSTDWGIDTTYSYIKYKGNHTFHSWEGISKDIDFNLECDEKNLCTLKVTTPLEKFDSGNDSRDSNMLYYTESLLYSIVTFQSDGFILPENLNGDINITGSINFHGISNTIPVKITLKNNGQDEIWGSSSFNFWLDSFNVEKPSLLLIQISDLIEIEALFKIVRD